MDYYNEIKEKLIDDEVYSRVKEAHSYCIL